MQSGSSGSGSSRLVQWLHNHVRDLNTWSGALRGHLGMLCMKKPCFRNVNMLCNRFSVTEKFLGLWGWSGGSWDCEGKQILYAREAETWQFSLQCIEAGNSTWAGGWSTEQQRRVSQTCRTACKNSELQGCSFPELWQLLGWDFQWCVWVNALLYGMPIKNPLGYQVGLWYNCYFSLWSNVI